MLAQVQVPKQKVRWIVPGDFRVGGWESSQSRMATGQAFLPGTGRVLPTMAHKLADLLLLLSFHLPLIGLWYE